MRFISILIACIIGAGLLWQIAFPTYTHRYRLTVSIEIDGQIHTGSSVIEIAYVGQPSIGDVGPFGPARVRGQAVFVDLGKHGAVVAALQPGTVKNGSSNTTYLALRAYRMNSGFDSYRIIAQQRGRRDLAADNMPLFIWFENVADPSTARVVDPGALSDTLGPGSRLAAAYVEITNDPIVIDIDKKLPWYQALEKEQKGKVILQYPNQFKLLFNMLLGENT
jgi:hypothetical protein